ncbi:hypothetical protein [Oryzibacter oryziterrae]|nr:hypothetical protein [Oryzibacter oryziterrae]
MSDMTPVLTLVKKKTGGFYRDFAANATPETKKGRRTDRAPPQLSSAADR